MIKLIQINENYYINANEIKSVYVSSMRLVIDSKDDEKLEIKAGEEYYKTARKALGI